jgi:hypothetical protein
MKCHLTTWTVGFPWTSDKNIPQGNPEHEHLLTSDFTKNINDKQKSDRTKSQRTQLNGAKPQTLTNSVMKRIGGQYTSPSVQRIPKKFEESSWTRTMTLSKAKPVKNFNLTHLNPSLS